MTLEEARIRLNIARNAANLLRTSIKGALDKAAMRKAYNNAQREVAIAGDYVIVLGGCP